MKFDIQLKGEEDVMKNLQELLGGYPDAGAAALYEEGFGVDANMVPRIPVATGRLRNTHYVAPPTRDGTKTVVEIGVGTDYAVAVHERTEAHHPVGEAKFLEKALAARMPGMANRIAKRTEVLAAAGEGVSAIAAQAPTRPSGGGGSSRSGGSGKGRGSRKRSRHSRGRSK